MNIFIEEIEKRSVAMCVPQLMLQTVRFLTDYLNGDIYYKTNHADHNLQRSKAQFRLLTEFEKKYSEMQQFIKNL